MSVNKAIIIGRLGADPEVRYTQNGQSVANFNVATDETWTDKSGQKQEKVEWHRIVVWGRQAEHCGEYLRKGREVYIEGRIETREWQDRDGQRRFTTEIKAQNVTFLGSRNDNNYDSSRNTSQAPAAGPSSYQQAAPATNPNPAPAYGNNAPASGPQAQPAQPGPQAQPAQPGPPGSEFNDDDIPF